MFNKKEIEELQIDNMATKETVKQLIEACIDMQKQINVLADKVVDLNRTNANLRNVLFMKGVEQ